MNGGSWSGVCVWEKKMREVAIYRARVWAAPKIPGEPRRCCELHHCRTRGASIILRCPFLAPQHNTFLIIVFFTLESIPSMPPSSMVQVTPH